MAVGAAWILSPICLVWKITVTDDSEKFVTQMNHVDSVFRYRLLSGMGIMMLGWTTLFIRSLLI